MTKLVIFSIGKDKPGIVGAFTKVLFDFGCNIEDASMTILYNQFSMILIITTPDALELDNLKEALNTVGTSLGLFTSTKILDEEDEELRLNGYTTYMIRVSGSDKTGIAHHVTEVLARNNVNITDFNSKLVSKSKKPVYLMMIESQIPEKTDIKMLEAELKEVAQKLNVDISMDEIQYCEL